MRTTKTTLVALVGVCALLLLTGTVAQAAVTHPYVGSFGPGGPGAGTFGKIAGVAVEQSTQDVYVYDDSEGGRIYKFDAAGEPVAFAGLAGSDAIEGVGVAGTGEEQIAIDESPGPDKGDIYVAHSSEVAIYSAAGVKGGSLTGGEMCGVAVDSAGHVYVGIYPSTVKQYVPASNPVLNEDYVSSLYETHKACNVAVDSEGDVYGASYNGGVRKYEPSQFNTEGREAVSTPVATFDETGHTLAVDPSSTALYVDDVEGIAQYDDAGEPQLVGHFASGASGESHALEGSYGVAVDGTSGKSGSGDIYAGDDDGLVNVYGPAVTIAGVSVRPASSVTKTTATLEGTVDPSGIAVSSCGFEYWVEGQGQSEALTAACSPSPGSGGGPVEVTAALTGLEAATTYRYRLAAADTNGVATTAVATFETAVAVEGVQTEAASSVTATAATLDGSLEPNGLDAHYYFQYGESTEYGSVSPSRPGTDAGSASSTEAATTTLGGLEANTTYHYRLVAANEDGTTYGQDETLTTLPAASTATGAPMVSLVTRTGAVLTAGINDQNSAVAVVVQFVAEAGYLPGTAEPYANGASSPILQVPAAQGDQAAGPVPLTGLLAGTTYHYRVIVSNELGTAYSADQTFTTAAATPPLVITGAAAEVTPTGVLLSGSVGAEELQTSYEFEVGTDTGYGGGKLFGNAGASGAKAVSASLQYLIPGTTYHYRLVATNEDGTTYGQDMTFTTPGYPSSITAPASSPLLAVPAIAFPKVEPVTTRTTTKQKLQKALKACQRDKNKHKGASCEKRAQRKYGVVKKRTKA
jgi:hypothetical protein